MNLYFNWMVCCVFMTGLLAQPAAPRNLIASDGLYEKYVLIRWDAVAEADGYKVLRRVHPSYGSFQEVNEGWQRSNWLCDYGALPGVRYYYTVVSNYQGVTSAMAELNSGYVVSQNVAIDEQSLTSADVYSTAPDFSLEVSEPELAQAQCFAGESINFDFLLTNRYEAAVARTEIQYFLSSDVSYSWDDLPLLESVKVLSAFPPTSEWRLETTAVIPTGVKAGRYYLLIVSAARGNLAHLRATHIPLDIEER
ncbi:MAG: hypothetical protein HC821_04420 [Lewinella sp.]|nr:hypothetical protein [Lewinella sp.]